MRPTSQIKKTLLVLGAIAGTNVLFAMLLPSSSSISSGAIVAKHNKVDLGHLILGEYRTARFELHNYSSLAATNIEVITSCGCTVPKPIARILGPNEASYLEFEFHSTGSRVHVSKPIAMNYRIGDVPMSIVLQVVAEVSETIVIEPSIVEFTLDETTEAVQKQTVRLQSQASPLSVRSVSTNLTCLHASIESTSERTAFISITFDRSFDSTDSFDDGTAPKVIVEVFCGRVTELNIPIVFDRNR